MDFNQKIELAAHKAALELQRTQIAALKAQLVEKLPAKGPEAFRAAAYQPKHTAKAGPDPIGLRDGRLTFIQKQLVQRLKKFFQGLQLQALRTLRAMNEYEHTAQPWWDEQQADTDLVDILKMGIAEAGQAAFDAATVSYGLPAPWRAESYWLPEYVGVRADLIKGIDGTTKEALLGQLAEGYHGGEGIPALSQRVIEVFRNAIDWQAERIARTETIQAYGSASVAAYKAAGVEKVQMYDGPHDDSASCEAVDGMVVTLAEAAQLMALEHPNGVRAVAPYVELPVTLQPPQAAAAPFDPVAVVVEAMGTQQKAHQEFVKELLRSQQEFLVKALDRMTPPDVTFDLPPVNVNFNEGAIKSSTTIAEGAVQAAPVTFTEGSIQPQVPVTFEDGAIQAHTNFREGAIKVEPANLTLAEGAIRSETPITVMMPQPAEVVVHVEEEDALSA